MKPIHRFSKSLATLCATILTVIGIYAVTGSHASASQLYLSPANSSVLNQQSFNVVVYASTGTTAVNAVQANLSYNPSQLRYTGFSNAGTSMPLDAQSPSGTPNTGSLQFVRSTQGGSPAVSGNFLVLTVSFQAIAGSGSAAITLASGSAVYTPAGNNIVTSTGSAVIALTSPASTPVPTIAPTPVPVITPAKTPTPIGPSATPAKPAPAPGQPVAATTPVIAPAPGTATLYLTPASGSVANGTKLTVGIRVKTTAGLNSVQANLVYQAADFTFDSISDSGSAFPVAAQSTGGNGTVTIVRATSGGAPAVTGDSLVTNVTFIARTASGTGSISFASGSAALTAAGSSNISSAPVGGSYTFIGNDTGATTVASVNGGGDNITMPDSGTGSPIVVTGMINVTVPPADAGSKVTYQIDGHNISSTKIDTTYLNNGTHTLTAIVTKSDGSKQTITQPLSVNNKLTSWQKSRNTVVAAFGGKTSVALGTVVTLSLLLIAAVAFLILRPHLEASMMQNRLIHHTEAAGATGFGAATVVMPAGSETPSPLAEVTAPLSGSTIVTPEVPLADTTAFDASISPSSETTVEPVLPEPEVTPETAVIPPESPGEVVSEPSAPSAEPMPPTEAVSEPPVSEPEVEAVSPATPAEPVSPDNSFHTPPVQPSSGTSMPGSMDSLSNKPKLP